MADFSPDYMERLYERPKRLVEDVRWEQNQDATHRYTAQALVEATDGDEVMRLVGEYWGARYSFTLFYRNTGIRRWDFSGHYPAISGGHKHRYPFENLSEDNPYPVDDVTTSDANQALIDFLDESNIERKGITIDQIPGLNHYE